MNIKPEPTYHTQTALTKTIIIKTTMKTKQLVANTTTSTRMTKTKNISKPRMLEIIDIKQDLNSTPITINVIINEHLFNKMINLTQNPSNRKALPPKKTSPKVGRSSFDKQGVQTRCAICKT